MTILERSLEGVSAGRPAVLRGVIFRFACSYWLLFCIPVISTQISGFDWIGKAIARGWNAIIVWAGETILAIPYEITTAENGSGDKTADWVFVFCIASLALISTLVWSVVDRRRAHDARLRELLRVLIRYTLALTILGYGVSKLFFGQFPSPNGGRLMQRYGDSSPMGLMWTFMGASPAYVFLSGAMEALGAVLLLFRRTTLLGALVLFSVLVNIVALNFCYDVPVKIHSSHYLAMCIFLMLPDLGRLASVVLLNRATQPVARTRALPRRWMRVARQVIKFGVIGVVVVTLVKERVERISPSAPAPWYDGYWTVDKFVRDGQDVPALVTDVTRWRRIRFQVTPKLLYARWRFMDESPGELYTVAVDDKAQTLTFTYDETDDASKKPKPPSPIVLTYVRTDAEHVKLEGKVGAETLAIELERFQVENMLLVTRGFHWINEEPYNR